MHKRKTVFRGDYGQHPSEPCDGLCIPLTKDQHAIIDAEDFPKIERKRWLYSKGYAWNFRVGALHRIIFGTEQGFSTDHISGNGLDNRKQNLRQVTHQQNICNQGSVTGASQYKGVNFNKAANKWEARISVNGERKALGCYLTELEAATAYDTAAIEMHGEFARLNFTTKPSEEPHINEQCIFYR